MVPSLNRCIATCKASSTEKARTRPTNWWTLHPGCHLTCEPTFASIESNTSVGFGMSSRGNQHDAQKRGSLSHISFRSWSHFIYRAAYATVAACVSSVTMGIPSVPDPNSPISTSAFSCNAAMTSKLPAHTTGTRFPPIKPCRMNKSICAGEFSVIPLSHSNRSISPPYNEPAPNTLCIVPSPPWLRFRVINLTPNRAKIGAMTWWNCMT